MSESETTGTPAKNLLEGYISEDAMAEARGVKLRTLRAERQRGEGPPWLKMNRAIWYSEDGFRNWLKAIEKRPVRGNKAA
jgi:hypothetical protein